MNRFAGKFSFYYNDYKLIFFDSRVGFVHKAKTNYTLSTGTVPLPPETSMFFAYERMEGWVVLQSAFNGEIVAFGGEILEEILPTTIPTRNPRFYFSAHVPLFDLSLIRAARASGSWQTHLAFKRPDAAAKDVTKLRARNVEPLDLDRVDGSVGLSNLSSSATRTPSTFTFVQHADGVVDMTSAKKVDRYDFRQVGKGKVDLSGEDLNGVDFGYSDFVGAILKGTKFNNGKFARSRFKSADLRGADFTGASLDTVDFSNAASMDGTILTGVTGKSCDFSYCDLSTVVSPTVLAIDSPEDAPARFSHGKLKYPLLGPKWTKRHLDYLVIEDLPTDPIVGLDATNAVLIGMDLGGLKASSALFEGATMHAVGFTHAKLFDAKFIGGRLEGVSLPDGSALAAADFTATDLTGASFAHANVSGVSFTGANLEEGIFEGATMRGAVFSGAYLKRVDFSAVEQKLMNGVIFNYACLLGCNFQGADLTVGVHLEFAYLHGADFSSAKLAGASMANAGIAFDPGELSVRVPGSTTPSKVEYEKTIIDPAQCTSGTTRCPNGDLGPCTGNKLRPPQPFPTSWPWPGRRVWWDEP